MVGRFILLPHLRMIENTNHDGPWHGGNLLKLLLPLGGR